jgi:hypothetical protein
MHYESVAAFQDDAVAVGAIEIDQVTATLDPFGPSGDVVAELEDRIFSDRVEVVLAVNEAREPSLNNLELGIERGKCGVLGFHL